MPNAKNVCNELHLWANSLELFTFPYSEANIPKNGIYILFEKGEAGHGVQRIVRVGTHTGDNQLPSRLRQHFLTSNKDRSIFRKNIGRCFLAKAHDPYLSVWEQDMTTKAARDSYAHTIDTGKQRMIEKEISDYMQKHFSFAVIEVADKNERLLLESKLISTVSQCSNCHPSASWLGNFSPKEKIRTSGLWLVNELYKKPLSMDDMDTLTLLAP